MSKIISGRFEWNELWTLDTAAASHFYTGIFPWKAEIWDQATGYTLFLGKNNPEAGCHKLAAEDDGPHIKPRWNTYISAADVDALVSQASALGATLIVPAMEIPRVGRFAMLKDPQGAAFGLLCRSVVEPPRPTPPPSGAMVWNELLTSDAEAAFKFYSEIFGWELLTRIDMGPKGNYLVFGAEGVQRGGMMTVALPSGPQWLPYTEVDNTDETAVAAVKAGATLCLGPQPVPGGRIANFIDPQGVMFAVHSPQGAAPATSAASAGTKDSQAGAARHALRAAVPKKRKKTKSKAKTKSKSKLKTKPKTKRRGPASKAQRAPAARRQSGRKIPQRASRGAKKAATRAKKKVTRATLKRGSRRSVRRR